MPSETLTSYFDGSLAFCAKWWGEPDDFDWPNVYLDQYLETDGRPTAGLRRNVRSRRYEIVLPPEQLSSAEAFSKIVRLAFKRVFYRRPGPWNTKWVYDVMAEQTHARIVTSIWAHDVLGESSIQASRIIDEFRRVSEYWRGRAEVDLPLGRRWNLGLLRPLSTEAYWASVWLQGERIVQIVGWELFCTLSRHRTLLDWINSLPVAQRDLVLSTPSGRQSVGG